MFKKPDFGKPIFNLEIQLQLENRVFKEDFVSSIDQIEMWGLACHYAKQLLQGQKHVTDKNYLLNEPVKDLETKKAVLNIDECISGLIILHRALTEKLKEDPFKYKNFLQLHIAKPMVHIHYDNECLSYIKAKDKNIVLVD